MACIINDSNYFKFVDVAINGEARSKGLIRRDFGAMPYGSLPYARGFDMDLISEDEVDDRIADQERNKTSLEYIRKDHGIRSLDQDGYGYCWAFSTTKASMLVRAVANQPMVELSGWALGAIIKNYRNQGGWCQESLEFGREVGFPSLKIWPQGGVNRKYDTAEMRAEAAERKILEWMDMEGGAINQLWTCLLNNVPVMVEYNWWGHSVCALAIKRRKPLQILIDNSWTPDWGDDGMAILEGSKAVPANMACPRTAMAA